MRKELEEILSKTVDDMTPADARLYYMALNHNKQLLKGSAIFMAATTALALCVFLGCWFWLNRSIASILGIMLELAGVHLNLFYLLSDFDQQKADNYLLFEKGEKKEFKKAHGFEKMRQLLTEYEELYGKSYLNEDNDPQTYDEYLKKVEAAKANEKLAAEQAASAAETKIKKADEAEQAIAKTEQGEETNKTL